MYAEADVPVLPDDRLARMNSHAHEHLGVLRPGVLGQRSLGEHSSADGGVGTLECEEERVALVVDLAAALLLDGLPQDSMMFRKHFGVALAELLQDSSRARNVGKEERDRPPRQLGHTCLRLVQESYALVGPTSCSRRLRPR